MRMLDTEVNNRYRQPNECIGYRPDLESVLGNHHLKIVVELKIKN